ncbi:hypothetical protein [Aeromonas hydrophila]|uniref:hypothetical protein n=1 Tax=Aeromonas hydrophila TaxID=644 RepID=UPI0011818E4A|nr:hypothetical protein [Aeromonas hydrophila]WRK90014.1 hypothetical protein U8518_11230 [Aeromonas hydrophila]
MTPAEPEDKDGASRNGDSPKMDTPDEPMLTNQQLQGDRTGNCEALLDEQNHGCKLCERVCFIYRELIKIGGVAASFAASCKMATRQNA